MSFNLDDPLAGILSDGSDDSFFDDDILGKKKPIKKSITPIAEKKKSLFNLGESESVKTTGVGDSKRDLPSHITAEVKKTGDHFKSPSPAPLKRAISKEKVQLTELIKKSSNVADSFDFGKSPTKTKPITGSAQKLDILGDLIPDTSISRKEIQKPLQKGKSSQSLLDDILGGSSIKPVSRPPAATANQDFDLDNILGKSESKPPMNTVTSKSEKPKNENPPAKKATKSSDDWLGIFQNKDEDPIEVDTGMPAWLSGGDAKKKLAEDKKSQKTEPDKEVEVIVENKENVKTNEEEQVINEIIKPFQSEIVSLPVPNEDVTAEGAALYLQQQESQVMVAMQLKAQEEKLAAMQKRQKESQRVHREVAHAQHAQLDSMLKRQVEQRQQMQAIIALHQERITQRIKALLSTSNIEDSLDGNTNEASGDMAVESKESPHAREKKQLLQLVQSLQENHDKEIDLMETSYRRQLAFQEISLTQAEERMKEESDKLVRFYSEKTDWLEEHHQLFKKRMEENLNSINDQHRAEIEMLRQQHLENVRVLQEHHGVLMENVKNAVKQEQNVIKDSIGFSSDLTELVADVKESKTYCQAFLEKVQVLSEHSQQSNERSVTARESQITDMIEHLKKEKENFETEKTENRDMIKLLESRLKQMTTMIEEETAALKQKKMEMDFEKATFNKQTEFAKNLLKRQEDEVKMVREDIQKEYQERIAKMDEEKSRIIKDSAVVAKEKASIQNLKQELEKMKAELQAQLEEVTEERSKLSVEKQQMHLEEQRIIAKSRDLDLLAKTAIDKQSQADKKYSEAEFLQRKYEERIRRIQEHVVSLNSREKQIAREKVALSRERLGIHNERKQMEQNFQCSLCKSQSGPQYYEGGYIVPEAYSNVSRDYDNANVSSAMNAIEQEMATLMGRTFTLRHGVGLETNLNNYVDKDMPSVFKPMTEDDVEAIPTVTAESGAFKEFVDPKFMMLRLDIQRVLNNTAKVNEIDEFQVNEGDNKEGENSK